MYVLSEFICTISLNPSFTELIVIVPQVLPATEDSDPELQLVRPQKDALFKLVATVEVDGSIV